MIRGLLARALEDQLAPALQARVCRGDSVLLDVALGRLPDGRAVNGETLFDLASLTKPLLTAAAWTELWAEGKDGPGEALLPGLPVEAVLRHRGGFPAHRRFDHRLGQLRPGSRAAWNRIVAAAAGVPRGPAGPTIYSDIGFIVLGDRVERRSGRSLEGWARSFGFEAFDRRDGPRAIPANLAPAGPRGWVHDDNARAMGGVAGHAGLFGSAKTVAAAARWALDRHRTSPEWQAAWAVDGGRFGLGWDHPSPGGTAPGWPQRAVGHLGFTGTSLWIDPETELTAVLLTNRVVHGEDPAPVRALRRRFHAAVWREWGPTERK